MRKSIILFLALLLPLLVFVFLKRFGKNEFDIPVFFAQSADSLNQVCGTHYTSPYTVPDSVLAANGWKPVKATVWVFDNSGNRKELKRLSDNFKAAEYTILEPNAVAGKELPFQRWESCVFFIRPKREIVLMDEQKRIRGYYEATSLDEMDRLIVEMKILLKQY